MVKVIHTSERDISSLQDLRAQNGTSPTVQPAQPKDYRQTVVLKPWGYEFLLFENELVAAWFLHIKGGHSTSMHCHPKKKTSLMLLSGLAMSYTFGQRTPLSAFEAVIIDKGVFHSTQSISTNGIDLIEVETPPSKTDLVRLQDKYGRQSTGYEGLSEMVTQGLEKFRYFHFESESQSTPHHAPNYSVDLHQKDTETMAKQVHSNNYSLYCLCRGNIKDANQTVIAETGDVVSAQTLKEEKFFLDSETTLLEMAPKAAA